MRSLGRASSVEAHPYSSTSDRWSGAIELGWRDPDGQESYAKREYGWYRRCEVVQLSGAHLESCRHSLDCPGCPSGFCGTELVDELWPSARCFGSREPWPVRFVGGALDVDRAWLQVSCMTERP